MAQSGRLQTQETTLMGILTEQQLDSQAKKFDRRNAKVTAVVNAMRDGNALHLEFKPSDERWRLSNGREVDPKIARAVIVHPSIVGVGDALFTDVLAQTFRFTKPGVRR
jgi:hypothetical protein